MMRFLIPSAVLCTMPVMALAADRTVVPHTEDNSAFMQKWSFSGTVTAASDYVFRGVSQHDERPVLQSSLDLVHDDGWFLGVWGSQVDFDDGDEASREVDLYAGYSFEYDAFSATLTYAYYAYPGADSSLNYNYSEWMAEGAYDFDIVSLGALYAYSPDFFGSSGDAHYLQAKLDVPLPYDVGFHAYLGHQSIEKNDMYGLPDTTDWNIGFSYSYAAFDFDVSYTDTDLDKNECGDLCSSRVVASVTYNF